MATKRRKRKSKKDKNKKASRKFWFLVAFFACVAFLIYLVMRTVSLEKERFEADKIYIVQGVDVSRHNTVINWGMLREKNIYFAYVKATEGLSLIDVDYSVNYELAKGANLKVGGYHFYSFGVSGKDQADLFIRNSKTVSGDMVPAIDVEHSRSNVFSTDTAYMALVVKELKVLEKELYKHYGVRPIIYTNHDCYNWYVNGNFPDNKIWISSLDREPSDNIDWVIWQYSHTGRLHGVSGDIDLNYYQYSFDDFKELLLP